MLVPPNYRGTIIYAPPAHIIYLLFGIVYGRPRDFATGNVITTTDYGYRHKGGLSDLTRKKEALKWHLDPQNEALYEKVHPLHLICTENRPMTMEFFNNVTVAGAPITVIQDFNIWILECNVDEWKNIEQYFRGYYKLFHKIGGMTEKELDKLLRSV